MNDPNEAKKPLSRDERQTFTVMVIVVTAMIAAFIFLLIKEGFL